jgi:hypothetical protein
MSVGPLGSVLSSAAGAPQAQPRADVDQAEKTIADQHREAQRNEQADAAAGIAQPDGEEHEAEDRDADGRRMWEEVIGPEGEMMTDPATHLPSRASRDASGERGHEIDLSG